MRSPILEHHTGACAEILRQGEWELVAHYGDSRRECVTATDGAGIRDATHLSIIDFEGADHLDFLHRMTTNDFVNLPVGGGVRAVFPDNRGRIIEAGTFCRLSDTTTRFVGGPDARKRLPAWLDRYVFAEQIEWIDRLDDTCALELFGPRAFPLANTGLGVDVEAVPSYGRARTDGDLNVTRLDLGPLPGIQVSGRMEDVIRLWHNLLEHGASPVGELAFQALRVQFGHPLPGPELNEDHNPWEAGLTDAIHLNKGCYIGQEVIARLDTYDKVKKRLVGLRLASEELPHEKIVVVDVDGREVGNVTSAVYSPILGHGIALAYVRTAFTAPGTRLHFGDGPSTADVVELPFTKPV